MRRFERAPMRSARWWRGVGWLALAGALSGVGCGTLAHGCMGRSQHEIRWPASPNVSLEQELVVSRVKSRRPKPPLPAPPPPPEPEELEPVLPAPGPSFVMGPDILPDQPGIEASAFEAEGLWVAELVMGEVAEGQALPLVMVLHGRGDAPRLPGGPFERMPTPMRVLVPRGPLVIGSGRAWARHSVTEGEARFGDIARDLMRQSDRLARVLAQVATTRPTLGTPIVTGFSQGGMVAWLLAMRHPEATGLALPIAGWVPPAARPRGIWRASPIRAMHGKADPIVPIGPSRQLAALLRQRGNTVEWRELAGVGHEVSEEMNQQFELWLEEALLERAPGLGGGLGEHGLDSAPVKPFEEPLDIDLSQTAVDLDALDASVLLGDDAGLPDGAVAHAAEGGAPPNAADGGAEVGAVHARQRSTVDVERPRTGTSRSR